jgi:ribonuclease HI
MCYILSNEESADQEDLSLPYSGWKAGKGRVIRSDRNTHYLGAVQDTNNTGELSAIIELLLELLATHNHTAVTVHYDSKWAANMTRGIWKANNNRVLVRTAQHVYSLAKQHFQVSWKWVKGHQGNKNNNYADELASQGRPVLNPQLNTGTRYSSRIPELTNLTHELHPIVDVSSDRDLLIHPGAAPENSTVLSHTQWRHNPSHPTPDLGQGLFHLLEEPPPATPTLQLWTKAVHEAAKACFKPITEVPRKPWITQETLDIIQREKRRFNLATSRSGEGLKTCQVQGQKRPKAVATWQT